MILLAWVLVALILTILVECGLSLLFRQRKLTYCVLVCNLLTNPLMNLLLIVVSVFFAREVYFVVLGFLELAVVGVEAFIITLMTETKPRKAVLLSLFFNASSFGVGLLLQALL